MKQRGLGRGFDSLIPTDVMSAMPPGVKPTSGGMVEEVDPTLVQPNPFQPRTRFDQIELQGLADSIKQYGILHPPVVTLIKEGRYELIAGERRVRAAILAGLNRIPVIVRSFDEQAKLELALLENVQRAQLNPIETALAYRKLAAEFNLTLEQIGARMGKAKSTVANSLRLLALPKTALEAVGSGIISEAHGRTIVALETLAEQEQLLQHIIKDGWTVRQAEEFTKNRKAENRATPRASASKRSARISGQNYLTQQLGDYLGAKVSLQPATKGGRLVIEYYSEEELQRIYETIKPSQ